MTAERIHDHFLKMHSAYERKGFQILIKEFRRILKGIPWDNITPDTAEAVIALNINTDSIQAALLKFHFSTGEHYGRLSAKSLLKTKKAKPFFSEAFQRFLVNYYATKGGALIRTITQTLIGAVMQEVSKAAVLNETVQQMQKRIYETVNKPDFYKWQAHRIARTETTFAMNSGKYVAGELHGIKLKGVWLGRNDGRERAWHIEANNSETNAEGFFIVNGEKLRFPGDTAHGASGSNVVNCRCTYVQKAAESFDDFLDSL